MRVHHCHHRRIYKLTKVCSEAGRTFLPRLPTFARFGETFLGSSLFFLKPLLLQTGEVYGDSKHWRDSVLRPVSALWAHHRQLWPMSPLSMARMSGLSLQSVWGMVPTISWCNSFSCMAKHVKLYICKQRRDTNTWYEPSSTEDAHSTGSSECMKQSHLCRVGWSGCDPPQQLTPRNHFNAVCSRRGTLLQVLHSRKTKISPPLTSFSGCRDNTDLEAVNPLWPFSPLSLSCCFSYELHKQWGLQHTGTPSTSHIEHTASFYCTIHTHTHTRFWYPKSFVMMLTGADGEQMLIKTN